MRAADHYLRRLPVMLVVLVTTAAAAADPDTSSWQCKACKQPQGWMLDTELGSGYVSDDSYKFGNYTGLDERGGFAVADLLAGYRGQDGSNWRLEGQNLGLDARSLALSGGRQGRYDLRLAFDQLPYRRFESSLTPFLNPGAADLRLPADWIAAAGTSGMDQLQASLRSAPVEWQRETFAVGTSFLQSPRLRYDLDYRQQQKNGTSLLGASFLSQATELPRNLDFDTRSLEAGASYLGNGWQARLGYFGSFFDNQSAAQRWDNPFTPLTAGAERGQLALEPDNNFQQLMLSAAGQPAARTQLSGRIAIGRMEQDEALLPFTLTAGGPAGLPRDSAQASVDTLHANLHISTQPLQRLRLRGSYTLDERSNDTPRDSWSYVVTDTSPGNSRDNLPYGHQNQHFELAGDYRFPAGVQGYLGWQRVDRRRDYSEVNHSTEDELWTRFKFSLDDYADLALRYWRARRDISAYQPVAETQPAQNPLLRKYDLAARDREGLSLNLGLRSAERLDLSFTAELRQDDYDASLLGLTVAESQALSLDGSWLLNAEAVITANLGWESIDSSQRGSQAFAAADWAADNRDRTVFGGLGLDLPKLSERLTGRLAYNYLQTRGETENDSSGRQSEFPDLVTRLQRLEAELNYAWRPDLDLHFGYYFENYSVQDWSRDGLNPDSAQLLLASGAQWLGYDVSVVMLSFSWRLDQH